ncbi:Fc.00g112270.m01.CDS01 [Cosmosporella sp. VM-42]
MTTPEIPAALITGGTAGLGAATARLFAKSGINVVVNYNSNSDRAEALVEELRATSPLAGPEMSFCSIKADLSLRNDLIELVNSAVAKMGRLDIVFSNGGWTKFRNIQDLDDNVVEEDWDHCFNMNVKSHLFLMHAAKPHLEKTEGVFITTASLAGVKAYSVTKAAQIHLVKGLALAAGPKVRVNCVSPGLMLTEWGLNMFSEEKREEMKNKTKLKRLATPEEVAEQVLCFVKSKSVTGVNAIIDAGISL